MNAEKSITRRKLPKLPHSYGLDATNAARLNCRAALLFLVRSCVLMGFIMQAGKLEKCIYDPASHTIWDVIVNGKTSIGGEEAEAYAAKVGGQIWDLDAAIQHEQNGCKTAPERITRGEFLDALEVLPPMHWRTSGRIETFKSSEFYSGIVTAIYCRIGEEYWTFRDCATLDHADIVTRCVAARYGLTVS